MSCCCNISFLIAAMSIFMSTDINKNDELLLEGHYHNNLPILEFESANQQSHLSSAELLHKSLGLVSYCQLRRKLGVPIKASEN